jgi:hypothetical protein
MQTHILTCREAKKKDLVKYLASLGHQPQKIQGNDHWYLSPLREEKTPSFKVNKKFNVWYDHGQGKGGNLIDFGVLYHRCSVRELLQKLNGYSSFQQPTFHSLAGSELRATSPQAIVSSGQSRSTKENGRIKILSEGAIQSPALLHYLDTRAIPVDLANNYCKQVDFELHGKKITALGFPNRSGGFELRNPNFKGSSSPKDCSFIDNGSQQVAVFEGFFSYLSFQTINQNPPEHLTNFLVLNSLSFFEKSRPLMEQHQHIHLFLDRDLAGMKCTQKALQWAAKYIDRSEFYARHKDLNEWLQQRQTQQTQTHRICRHL